MDNASTTTPSLKEILRPIRRNWGMILITFLGVVLTVGYLTLTSERVYEASATLSMRNSGYVQGDSFERPDVYTMRYLINNQVAILESRSLAAEVAKRLISLFQNDSLSTVGVDVFNKRPSIWERLSPWVRHPVLDSELSFIKIVEKFVKATRVSYGRDTDIVELKAKAPTPGEAALLVNLWVDIYQKYQQSDTHEEVIQTKKFLETKLQEVEEYLEASENKLVEYQRQNKVVSLSDETEQLVRKLSEFESLYNETKTDYEAVHDQLIYLKSKLDDSKRTLVEDMTKLSNPVLQELQSQSANLMAEKAAYEAQLIGAGFSTKGNSKLSQMESRLKGIQEKIIEETKKLVEDDLRHINPLDHSENLISQILELETEQKSLEVKTRELKSIVDDYARELEVLPNKSRELARLDRDVQVNTKIYVMLRERYEETKIREAGQVGIARVLDLAVPPNKPIHPKTRLNMMLACLFGLLLGIGVVFVREYFEDSIRQPKDLEALGLRAIGKVPIGRNSRSHNWRGRRKKDWSVHRAKEIYHNLLIQNVGQPAVSEAYRSLRTVVYLTSHQKKMNTILVTSSHPGEGKSTTASNLAITMANRGVKTLLVDSDLRRPVLDVLFTGSIRKTGLTSHLGHVIQWKQAVRETTVEGLYLLAAGVGVKNASEILSSRSMFTLIKEAKDEYGIVFFDSPPLHPVTDAAVLASFVDGVILVVRAEKTSREDVKRSMEILKSVNADILGAVLTGAENTRYKGYDDYYQVHYKKRGEKK